MRFLKGLALKGPAEFLAAAYLAFVLLVAWAFIGKNETLWYWVMGAVVAWFVLSVLFAVASTLLDKFGKLPSRGKGFMVSQIFVLKVAELGEDRERLVALMNELDEEKRAIRSFMRQFSNEPKDAGGGAGPERYRKLRRLKDRLGHLIQEREYVRQKLGQLDGDRKALNKAAQRKIEFCQAFLAAAERTLDEQTFRGLEARAMLMLTEHPD